MRLVRRSFWTWGLIVLLPAVWGQDEVELLSGTRIQGKILERTEQSVKIQVTADGRQLTRSFPLSRVRAVTENGQRRVINTGGIDSSKPPSTEPVSGSELVQRAPADVEALIEQAGRTPPTWFEAAPLDYPQTLDLSWPDPAPVIWNYTRNVDHYIWDIISSNPKRYQSGVRLMHHLLAVNQQHEGTRVRAMNELGRMYFEYFRDYARAAFWWRQAKVDQNAKFAESTSPAQLAECYWRLGTRSMAVDLLTRLPLTPAVVKVWGDLKETEKALALCDEGLKRGFLPSQTYLLAGDVCRAARNFTKAAEFYQRAQEVPATGNTTQVEQIKRDHDRARATLEVIRLFDALDVSRIADGKYPGKSLGYSGNLEVEAIVKGGRTESLEVTHNPDRQYFHAVEETIRRILARQTVNGVDAISGATITSEAVIRAAAKALAEGMNADAVSK
ncbi:MAG: FMN-binding protein [Verrucomicrobia bacterium]|nr:FMN-binding protein [Verrucomicrobiota bacterium]